MDKEKIEQLAKEIYDFCIKNELWGDCCIYFNGKAWSSLRKWKDEEGKKLDNTLYEYENKDPKTYFQWVAEPNILSMSFEGGLYSLLNGYSMCCRKLSNEFSNIFNNYGLYYELGDSWNFTVAEM